MVETGRKSARDPQRTQETEHDKQGDGSDEEFVQGSSNSKKRTRTQSTPKVSTKSIKDNTQGQAEPTKASGGKRRKPLSLLLTMSLDILYEIRTSPNSPLLYKRFQTHDLFHETLNCADGKPIWMEARKPFGAPEPPDDVTEVQWAKLLFDLGCQNCDTRRGVRDADWNIRKRIRKKLYFEPDVLAALRRWTQLNTLTNTPSGRASLEEWKAKRRAFVSSCRETAKEYERWEASYHARENDTAQEVLKNRREATIKLFLALDSGYTQHDVEEAFRVSPDDWKGSGQVTDRAWTQTLRPKLEPVVRRLKANLEARENEPLIQARLRILDNLYDGYLTTLKPSDRYLAPHHSFLDSVPNVWPTIHKPFDMTVGPEDFQFVVDQFSELVSQHQSTLKEKVIKTISPSPGDSDDPWNLAKHVFRCEQAVNQASEGERLWMASTGVEQILFGWPAVAGHRYRSMGDAPGPLLEKPQCNITLHCEASAVASALIVLAGLDPASATRSDMDARDARFAVAADSIPTWWTSEYPV
ncbi:hypothetical protein BKA70DRAFT_1424152 [Coprinopsis sp. MPI-PUGE-AT-0042]|nr:hypothetical protein BKA70DRAFT_1424152 [Coprinopsis sp. MPI-PUGE-AT-0042]